MFDEILKTFECNECEDDMNTEQFFIDEQTDFFNYLVEQKAFEKKQTYRDYITRLRYVSKFYKLDKSITKDYIAYIINDLKKTMKDRKAYNSLRSISDIASGLKKFLEYVNSDFNNRLENSILTEEQKVKEDNNINQTEKDAIIKARVGQGLFRQKLMNYWKGCSVTECKTQSLLMASHIKPWRDSTNEQRLDVYNGLLLIPNLDKLFDKGYISFDKNGSLICSSFIPQKELEILGISPNMHLMCMEKQHLMYLKYHREFCLL
jgi:predicted restriction endonuclease